MGDDVPHVPPTDWSGWSGWRGWRPDLTQAQRDFLGDMDQLAPIGIAALRLPPEGDADAG
jgi:hypothetical protein